MKFLNNPGNIPLPRNCASVLKVQLVSPRVISASNRTKTNHHWLNHLPNFTRPKLRYFARDKTNGKFPNLCINTRKPWTHLSSSFS